MRDLNSGTPNCKSNALTTRPRCLHGASEPRGDRGYKLGEDIYWSLALLVFVTLNSNPQVFLELVSCRYTTGCATLHCKCRKSYVLCSGLCGCIKVYAQGGGGGVSKVFLGLYKAKLREQ